MNPLRGLLAWPQVGGASGECTLLQFLAWELWGGEEVFAEICPQFEVLGLGASYSQRPWISREQNSLQLHGRRAEASAHASRYLPGSGAPSGPGGRCACRSASGGWARAVQKPVAVYVCVGRGYRRSKADRLTASVTLGDGDCPPLGEQRHGAGSCGLGGKPGIQPQIGGRSWGVFGGPCCFRAP